MSMRAIYEGRVTGLLSLDELASAPGLRLLREARDINPLGSYAIHRHHADYYAVYLKVPAQYRTNGWGYFAAVTSDEGKRALARQMTHVPDCLDRLPDHVKDGLRKQIPDFDAWAKEICALADKEREAKSAKAAPVEAPSAPEPAPEVAVVAAPDREPEVAPPLSAEEPSAVAEPPVPVGGVLAVPMDATPLPTAESPAPVTVDTIPAGDTESGALPATSLVGAGGVVVSTPAAREEAVASSEAPATVSVLDPEAEPLAEGAGVSTAPGSMGEYLDARILQAEGLAMFRFGVLGSIPKNKLRLAMGAVKDVYPSVAKAMEAVYGAGWENLLYEQHVKAMERS